MKGLLEPARAVSADWLDIKLIVLAAIFLVKIERALLYFANVFLEQRFIRDKVEVLSDWMIELVYLR